MHLQAGKFAAVVSTTHLMLQLVGGELDRWSHGQGMRLRGNFSIAGFFPLHYGHGPDGRLPALAPCKEWVYSASLSKPTFSSPDLVVFLFPSGEINKHGFHLLHAMKLAVEEINNHTGSLLPGVMLGYQMYDTCSESASILASLDVLNHWSSSQTEPKPVAVIGPDSSSNTFTPATLLGAFLIPQVSQTSDCV